MRTQLTNRRNRLSKKFMKKCPVTSGTCLNPMCMFGCIER